MVSGNLHRTLTNSLIGKHVSEHEDAYKWVRPVHRLDAATSGLVLFAKTRSFHRYASDLFTNRKIDKFYSAIVQGKWTDHKLITIPVDDKKAESIIEGVKTVKSLRNDYLSLVKLVPKTGRTHQLRIHCAQEGFPIVGDKRYGNEGDVMKHKGLFLCARKLTFTGMEGQSIFAEIPLPKKFETLLLSCLLYTSPSPRD